MMVNYVQGLGIAAYILVGVTVAQEARYSAGAAGNASYDYVGKSSPLMPFDQYLLEAKI
jgi:hypothetical protein